MAFDDESKDHEFEEEEDTQKDKYLTFSTADESYAIEIYFVTEIVGIQEITEVPDMPEYIMGVINLRGRVIPVIDIRLRFNLPFKEYTDRTCVIVVDFQGINVGIIVDEVAEVQNIPETNIDPPPRTGKGEKSKYIKGMAKVDDEVIVILNVDTLLSEQDMQALSMASIE